MSGGRNNRRMVTAAMLASLHVGIEPALLTLLIAMGAVFPGSAGWVVGAGQLGMACGALLCRRMGQAMSPTAPLLAVVAGVAASLALAVADNLGTVLASRLALGCAMGLLYAGATAQAARQRPHRTIGLILLGQQAAASLALLLLPVLGSNYGARPALATVALVPAAIALVGWRWTIPNDTAAAEHAPADRPANALAPLVALALLAGTTLMVWSYVGIVGVGLGFASRQVDLVIGLASVASLPAALLAAWHSPKLPPAVTAFVCGFCLIAPLLVPAESGISVYAAALALFNAAAAFAGIRLPAWAMQADPSLRGRQRTIVVQAAAMTAGSPAGALAMRAGGLPALTAIATALAGAATLVLIFVGTVRTAAPARIGSAMVEGRWEASPARRQHRWAR